MILTIPATSVACVRAFTHVQLVKSDWRTLLNELTLSDCLMIKLEVSHICTFNPDAAIKLWFETDERRPRSTKSLENVKSIICFVCMMFQIKSSIPKMSPFPIFILSGLVDAATSTRTTNLTARKANMSETIAEVANIIPEDDYQDEQLPQPADRKMTTIQKSLL